MYKYISDSVKLLVIISLSIISIYFSPKIFAYIFYIAVLFLFYFDKKTEYLWIVFVFFFIDAPGGLFYTGSLDDTTAVPVFKLISGVSLFFHEVFIIVAILKIIKQKYKKSLTFINKELLLLLFLIGIVYINSMGIGMSIVGHIKTIRVLFLLNFIVIFPRLFNEEEKVLRFYMLISQITIMVLLTQFYYLLFGSDLVKLLTGVSNSDFSRREGLEARPIFSIYLVFLTLVLSLFYSSIKDKRISKAYLNFSTMISLLVIFLSATRGWILASLTVFLLYIIFVLKVKSYLGLIPIVVIVMVLAVSNDIISNQIQYTLDRSSVLTKISIDNPSANGSIKRLSVRGPWVMQNFYENPLFGWGFSDKFGRKGDAHVGIQNTLAITGVFGFLFFLRFWTKFILKINSLEAFLKNKNIYKNSLKVFNYGFLGLILINMTSTMIFGFFPMGKEPIKIFTLSLFITITSIYYKQAKEFN